AFVTNQVASFWNIAEKGALDAAADPKINVHVVVRMPSQATPEDQKRIVQELLARGDIKGIAISPLNPDVQGELLEEIAARPDGGEVMIFVGRLGQANARLRRQGVIDAVLGRKPDRTRSDPVEGVLKEGKYTILGTELDGGDNDKARAKAQEAITNHPNLACM